MDQKKITDTFSVSGQINLADIEQLKSSGVKTIICNRPDHEDVGQPEVDTIKQAAIKAGLNFYFMPVISGQISKNEGDQFTQLLETAPKPIHAYCRSGTRCSILWALSELTSGKDKTETLGLTASAGYDLSKTFQ